MGEGKVQNKLLVIGLKPAPVPTGEEPNPTKVTLVGRISVMTNPFTLGPVMFRVMV